MCTSPLLLTKQNLKCNSKQICIIRIQAIFSDNLLKQVTFKNNMKQPRQQQKHLLLSFLVFSKRAFSNDFCSFNVVYEEEEEEEEEEEVDVDEDEENALS